MKYVFIMNLVSVHSLIPEVIFQEIESSPSVVSAHTHLILIVLQFICCPHRLSGGSVLTISILFKSTSSWIILVVCIIL